MPHIATARTSLVLDSKDIVDAALLAGWRHAEVVRPEEELCGAARLQLAQQFVSVRLVVDAGEDTPALLNLLKHDVLQSTHTQTLEYFIILVGVSNEVVRAYHNSFANVTTRRVTVGSWLDYLVWVEDRLGPLANLPVDSGLRKFVEHLLCVNPAPVPTNVCATKGSYDYSTISKQLKRGQAGVQAIQTLLEYTRGKDAIFNVENDRNYQKQDIDLLLTFMAAAAKLSAEVKAEYYKSGFFMFEWWSYFGNKILTNPDDVKRGAEAEYHCEEVGDDKKTQGWGQYCKADVLITLLPSGDVIMSRFSKVKEWLLKTADKDKVLLVECSVKEQNFYSQCYRIPVNTLLAQVPESVFLRLQDWVPLFADWLPVTFEDKFSPKSLISARRHSNKLLRPQRLTEAPAPGCSITK
jgi:hypothetical protein